MKNNIITMENIKSGNCQFNAKTASNFRATLSKWHNGVFDIANELLLKSDRVKALNTLINSNKELIVKLEKGEKVIGNKTIDGLQDEINLWMETIQQENSNISEYRQAQESRITAGEKLVTKELYNFYVASINGDDSDRDEYTVALGQFLANNGVEPCKETIDKLILTIGKKVNSSRNMCKTGRHNGTFSFVAWRKIFLGELCDLMGDALPLYKFTYVLKDKRNK